MRRKESSEQGPEAETEDTKAEGQTQGTDTERTYKNEDDHKSQKSRDWESKSKSYSSANSEDSKSKTSDSSSEKPPPNEDYKSSAPSSTSLTPSNYFATAKNKNKDSFLLALDMYSSRDKHRRGHVEFIYAALRHMKQFNVHRDLETYKKVFEVFPKGKFIPQNWYQVEFMHFPKQQQCAVDLLEQMEEYTVQPDSDFQTLVEVTFGNYAIPMRKFKRMAYWMPKFKNLSPWPLPEVMPDSSFELAKLAIARITSVDLQTKITCLNTMDIEDAVDHTWIISGQSPAQMKLIEELQSDRPVYVEGAFRVWLQRTCINYFILRAEPRVRPKLERDEDDVGFLQSIFSEKYTETQLETLATVHEQEDGVILACCATGTSSRDSVVSWVKFLEEANPRLGKDISVLFTLRSPIGPTDDLEVHRIPDGKSTGNEFGGRLQAGEGEDKPEVRRAYNRLGNLDDDWADPQRPSLRRMGINDSSETKFVNWPHHFNGAMEDQESSERVGGGGEEREQNIEERRKEFQRLVLNTDPDDPSSSSDGGSSISANKATDKSKDRGKDKEDG